mmetsp:Transcript_12121/g.32800  ORF Transcript_12121/g.32800 Transcript_12121/m.32800 type:complete len:304 (-) Transcript_12121:49-960(-)
MPPEPDMEFRRNASTDWAALLLRRRPSSSCCWLVFVSSAFKGHLYMGSPENCLVRMVSMRDEFIFELCSKHTRGVSFELRNSERFSSTSPTRSNLLVFTSSCLTQSESMHGSTRFVLLFTMNFDAKLKLLSHLAEWFAPTVARSVAPRCPWLSFHLHTRTPSCGYCRISWIATSTSNSILRFRFEIEKKDVALLAALEAKSTTAAILPLADGPRSWRLRPTDHAGTFCTVHDARSRSRRRSRRPSWGQSGDWEPNHATPEYHWLIQKSVHGAYRIPSILASHTNSEHTFSTASGGRRATVVGC